MDHRLEHFVNVAWTHPALDRLMATASSFDVWLPFIVAAILLTAFFGRARARWFLLTLTLTLAIGDGLLAQSLKRIVHRPRPAQEQAGIRQVELDRHARPALLGAFRPLEIKTSAPTAATAAGRSFPSSHTMNNFAAATLLALFYRRWGWLYFGPAALVGYSRVYVGSHWPSDVAASALLAVALTGAVASAVDAARPWLTRKLAPCCGPQGSLL